jgi:hypothetical protein
MPTQTSVGSFSGIQTEAVTKAAVQQALARLPAKKADWGVVFAARRHDIGTVLWTAQEVLPSTLMMGCSSAGELVDRGLCHNSVTLMLGSSDEMSCSLRLAKDVSKDYRQASALLCKDLEVEARAAAEKRLLEPCSIVLGDTLKAPFEKLVGEMRRTTKPHQKLVGGAAADDATFSDTPLGIPGDCGTNRAAALHLFTRSPVGVGLGHGFEPLTDKKTVTKSDGALIAEIDGKPAYEVFVDFARERGMRPEPNEPPTEFLKRIGGNVLSKPVSPLLLGVYFFDDVCRVRALQYATPEGGVLTTGEIPVGSNICVIGGDQEGVVGAARAAAEEACGNLKGRKAAGVLVFTCLTRKFTLGEQYNREIEAVRSVFPDTPLCGLLSYGEVARFNGRLDGYHNATCVVAALPAHG